MNVISRFFAAVLRVVLLAFGALLLLGTLFAAFVLGSLALLRGRRPAIRASFGQRFEQARRQARRAPAGEVIDIEVREVR